MGSMDAARRAGTKAATRPQTMRSRDTEITVSGSCSLTPNKNDFKVRVTSQVHTSPPLPRPDKCRRIAQNEKQNVAPFSTKRHANADFAPPTVYREGHESVKSDQRQQQCNHCECGQQRCLKPPPGASL